MSQRAAWQLERLGFGEVYDFVVGKAHWLASGRPTVRPDTIDRVGAAVTAATTASVDDTAAAVRAACSGTSRDVIVVGHGRIVLGRVRRSDLQGAAGTAVMGEIMRLGPTTIRPDEIASNVRHRMSNRGVASSLVTRPTGELLGEFIATDGATDE